MKIYLMMLVINFESVSSEENLYNQSYNNHLLLMKENHNINDKWKSFYIEKLLDYHLYYYRHDKQIIKYLIKWTNYELKQSANMKIHSVISVINLKFVSSEKDFYNQSYDDYLLPVKEDHNVDDEWKSFYIEKLLNCHFCHYKHDKQIIKYLIK